jgi:hypothetical protein
MTVALVTFLAWLQQASCTPAALDLLKTAEQRARLFDLPAAVDRAAAAGREGCTDALVESWYLRGLVAAREAYRDGGSPESLAPVREAIAALEQIAGGAPGPAEIARVTLLAASAAAQSEREEMAVFLDFALRMESLQFAAGQPGAPGVAAHEAAGDFWLQVDRYEDARRAYEEAAGLTGATPRVLLGLARAAVRLELPADACAQYRALAAILTAERADGAEADEARRYLESRACSRAPAPSRS